MSQPMIFDIDGLLPVGDYDLTLSQLKQSILVRGPLLPSPTWDAVWRRQRVDNLAILALQLWTVGITDIYVDGSFAEAKDHPNDIDGYFVCDARDFASGRLERALNKLDPHKVWTWHPSSRRPAPNSAKRQLPMWHQYRVELYPHYGNLSGIQDRFGNNLPFPAAFRLSRGSLRPKGIVHLLPTVVQPTATGGEDDQD